MNITKTDSKSTIQKSLSALAAVGIILLGNVSQAGEATDGPPQRVVKYADLSLTNSAAVEVLYRRIQNAATEVCGSVDPREFARAAQAKVCTDRAIAKAVSAINSPLLTSHFLSKGGNAQKALALASLR